MEGETGQEILSRLPGPAERRARLRRHMRDLAATGRHCGACSGVCCTFVANSMRISPVEALDLKHWLQAQGRWTPELIGHLRETVRRYRLDQESGDGRRALRKTYTCPFYRPGPLGCSIHPDHKPYGCLAFNARSPGITEGGDCASAQSELHAREADFPAETAANAGLRQRARLPQEARPIPLALLDLADFP